MKYCPHCNSKNFIKNGKFKDTQRYKCKNCSKNFSTFTKTFYWYGKKIKTSIKTFINLSNSGLSLASCANLLKISTKSAFDWRHKILDIYNTIHNKYPLYGTVELHNYRTRENFKGQSAPLTKERKLVLASLSIDSNLRSNPRIYSIGSPSHMQTKKNLEPILSNFVTVYGYSNTFLSIFAKKQNEKFNKIPPEIVSILNRRYPVGFMASIWMERFYGVATKYLEKYLSWYQILYKEAFLI